jgi:hypothetical protein
LLCPPARPPARDIAFADVTPEGFATSLRGVLPPWQVDGLLEHYAHYRRGEAAEVTTTVTDLTGQAPGTSASSPATTPRRSAAETPRDHEIFSRFPAAGLKQSHSWDESAAGPCDHTNGMTTSHPALVKLDVHRCTSYTPPAQRSADAIHFVAACLGGSVRPAGELACSG